MLYRAQTFLSGLALSSLCSFAALGTAHAAEVVAPAASAPAATVTAAPISATEAFKARHTRVLELVKNKAEPAALQKEVDDLLDYKSLAESSLGGPARYASKCESRCAEFEGLLARLIRENYLKRVRTDKKYEVTYLGETEKLRSTRVTTNVTLSRDGKLETVEVVYVMHQVDGAWKCEDIITDGVSLVKNFRFEFNKILKDKGIGELITRLETKLAELTGPTTKTKK